MDPSVSASIRNDTCILRRAAAAAVLVGIAFGPIAFGATEVWSACALEIIAALAGVFWIFSRMPKLGLLLLPASVVGLGILQLFPLPSSWLALVSPLSHDAHTSLLEITAANLFRCVSVHPGATLAAVRRFFLMAMTVAVVADVTRSRSPRRVLAWTVAMVGVGVLLLGILFSGGRRYVVLGFHDMTGPIRPWKNPLLPRLHSAGMGYPDVVAVGNVHYTASAPVVGDVFGPYVNSNHFAGCMALTLPVGLGLLLGCPARSRRRRMVLYGLAALLACGALLAVAIGAHSRAGVVALLAGALAVGCLAAHRKRTRVAWGLALGLFLLTCAVTFGFAARWRGVEDSGRPQMDVLSPDGFSALRSSARHRLKAWETAGKMLLGSPLLGAGLGTYGEAQTAFAETPPVQYFAHNDYVQFAAETGILGLLAGVCIAGLIIRRIRKGPHEARSQFQHALRLGILGAVAAIGVHSAFDYNLHVPANLFIFSVLMGLLLGGTAQEQPARRETSTSINCSRLCWVMRAVVAAATGYCVLSSVQSVAADRLVAPLRRALVVQRDTGGGLERPQKHELLSAALPAAERACEIAPLNAEYAGLVGQAYLHLADGRKLAELGKAAKWFSRSLRLCPINTAVLATVEEIHNELSRPVGQEQRGGNTVTDQSGERE